MSQDQEQFTSESFSATLIDSISRCARTGEPSNIRLTVDTEVGPRKLLIAVCPEEMVLRYAEFRFDRPG